MAGKLTEEQRQEIVRRYEAGESQESLRRAFRKRKAAIREVLEELPIRSTADQLALGGRRGGKRPWVMTDISASALHEAYWGAQSGYPSMTELARRWGVCKNSLRARLIEAGIRIRSKGEQLKIEIRAGRVAGQGGALNPSGTWTSENHHPGWLSFCKRERQRVIAKRAAARKRRVSRNCWWCGDLIELKPSECLWRPHATCSSRCRYAATAFSRRKDRSEIRPLIARTLRDLLRREPYKSLPFTFEIVEKAGATIGAQEAEVFEVYHELMADRALLEKVLNAPPMAPPIPQPKKTRQKPAISPETLGEVGEAMLRAQRKEKASERHDEAQS